MVRPLRANLLLATAVILAIGGTLWRFDIEDGLRESLPTTGQLGRQAGFFEGQSSVNILAVELVGAETAAARFIADELTPLLARHAGRPALRLDPASLARLLPLLRSLLPTLLRPEDLDRLAGGDLEERLTTALRAAAVKLRDINAIASAATVYADPLGLCRVADELRSSVTAAAGHRYRGDHLRHADGTSSLAVYEIGFAPSDRSRCAALITDLQGLASRAAAQGLRCHSAGAYRHYDDNHRSIFAGLWFSMPITVVGIAVLMLSLYRSLPAILLLHLPAIASIIFATAALALLHGGAIPVMAFGFCPALMGISVDYGVHVVRACQAGDYARVRRPLLLSFATSALAFAVLLPGGFPILRSLGVFVIAGLGGAIATSLISLPALLDRDRQRRADAWAPASRMILTLIEGSQWRNLLIIGLLCAALLPGLGRLRLATELYQYDGSSPETHADLNRITERWLGLGSYDFIVADGHDIDEALVRGEQAVAAVSRAAALPTGISVVQRFLPSRKEQDQRRAAWNRHWQPVAADLPAMLGRAARAAGVRAEPFTACLATYAPVAADGGRIDRHAWDGTPVAQLLDQRISRLADGRIRVVIPLHLPQRNTALVDRLGTTAETVPGCWLASRLLLVQAMITEVTSDLVGRAGIILLAMLVFLIISLRRPRFVVAVASVPIIAIAWTFGLFGWLGIEITALHVMVAAFVIGIGVDNAIFIHRVELRRQAMSAVLMTALTTLIGAGSLIVASHPLLASIGFAVFTGMSASLICSLLVCVPIAGGRSVDEPTPP
jgi:predicted exporter